MRFSIWDEGAENYDIYCNGAILPGCYLADEEKCIANFYILDYSGNPIPCDDGKGGERAMTGTFVGHVKIKPRELQNHDD